VLSCQLPAMLMIDDVAAEVLAKVLSTTCTAAKLHCCSLTAVQVLCNSAGGGLAAVIACAVSLTRGKIHHEQQQRQQLEQQLLLVQLLAWAAFLVRAVTEYCAAPKD